LILQTSEERIKLLKSGFTGDQVEALYIDLNHFETVGVNWGDFAMNRSSSHIFARKTRLSRRGPVLQRHLSILYYGHWEHCT